MSAKFSTSSQMNLGLISILVATTASLASAANIADILKVNTFGQSGKKRVVVHRVGQCLGHKNLPIFFPDFSVSQYNRSHYVVNGEVIFNEDFPNGWEPTATVRRCDGFHASASCRPFLDNMVSSNVCGMLAVADAIYSRYLTAVDPKPQCPFRKGTYVVKDQVIYDDMAKFLPGTGSTYWEIKSTGMVGDRMVLCFSVQLNVRPKKQKASSGR
ncbi:uncharacterized protein LOC131688296 [Topomyia yanbarensis]|uniref:uncharacterized protein LOC131688296 n=1 Tax=Topomyia yanbarensis TaxID=2498891 RepID=UPI00273C0CFE|nr:uncharacterized protein LOC131688296 [Topomyia yanbarensis]